MKNNGLKNNWKLCFIFILTFVSFASSGQSEISWGTTVEKDEFTYDIHLTTTPLPVKTVKDISYYWVRDGLLKSTSGNYSGYLLHGLFEKFDTKDNLIEKGTFLYGAKHGNWTEWNIDIVIKEDVWDEGFLIKRKILQNDTVIMENYKKNKLNGMRTVSVKEKIIFKERYRNGEIIPYKNNFSWLKSIFRKKEVAIYRNKNA